jgi:hypothetical protein
MQLRDTIIDLIRTCLNLIQHPLHPPRSSRTFCLPSLASLALRYRTHLKSSHHRRKPRLDPSVFPSHRPPTLPPSGLAKGFSHTFIPGCACGSATLSFSSGQREDGAR